MSKKPQSKKKAKESKSGKPKSGAAGAKSGPMDISLLEQITVLMKEADLNTVDVRDGERRIVLKRGAVAAQMFAAPVQHGYAPPAPVVSAAPTSASAPAKLTEAVDSDAGLVAIKSPMVGTFYAASSPDAKPFVSVGSSVDDETDVCIIEAMKVFNNIKAETRGTIAKILVTNGTTVEFGQPLFLVKP